MFLCNNVGSGSRRLPPLLGGLGGRNGNFSDLSPPPLSHPPSPFGTLTPLSENPHSLFFMTTNQRTMHPPHPVKTKWKSFSTSAANSRALACKKLLVSSDHLPPTSTTRTTRPALWCGPTNSGYVLAFFRRPPQEQLRQKSAARLLALPSDQTRSPTSCQWPIGPPEQRETIRHNFEASPCRTLQILQIQVADHDVLCDPSTSLAADASCCALNRVPSTSQAQEENAKELWSERCEKIGGLHSTCVPTSGTRKNACMTGLHEPLLRKAA